MPGRSPPRRSTVLRSTWKEGSGGCCRRGSAHRSSSMTRNSRQLSSTAPVLRETMAICTTKRTLLPFGSGKSRTTTTRRSLQMCCCETAPMEATHLTLMALSLGLRLSLSLVLARSQALQRWLHRRYQSSGLVVLRRALFTELQRRSACQQTPHGSASIVPMEWPRLVPAQMATIAAAAG